MFNDTKLRKEYIMGKNIITNIIACLLVGVTMTSCFSDDGNYKYESIKPPKWLIDINTSPIYVYGRGGSDMRIDASRYFNWGELDSLERSKEVRYEWRINGKVFSTELKEIIPTDEFMKRLGLTEYPTQSFDGDFSIIEKETGITFKARTYVTIVPPIAECDFIIYSAKDNNTPTLGSLSVLGLSYLPDASGTYKQNFQFKKHASADITGTPKRMDISLALNVSRTGSVTTITQEGDAVVLNASTLEKAWDLSSQFADGVPANFKVSARRDQEMGASEPSFTWIATQDGRLFTRQTAKNYLGGKFITEPYYLDQKGYKITNFGHTLWGLTNLPCYDEKNHRVLIATALQGENYGSYRSYVTPLTMNGWQGAPIMDMPEDTEVLYLTAINGQMYWDRNNGWYQIYYNTGGKSMVGTFAVDNRTRRLNIPMAYTYYFPYEVTGHNLNKETVFLTAAASRYGFSQLKNRCDLFTEGDKLFAIVRSATWGATTIDKIQQLPLKGITSKITAMTYDRDDQYTGGRDYMHLLVGCENGDVLIYNVTNLPAPELIAKYNAGGKVVAIKQLCAERNTLDMY